MAQHDGVISNASGAAVRADLNNALAALITNSSGATSPGTTYAYQWWADTTTGQLKLRNSANSAWITIFELDGTMLMEDGTVSAPGLAFASDLNTGFFRSAADKINFATGGAERLEIGSSEVVFNDPSNDVDFRVESNGNTHMLFVDAGNDRVGIGAASPSNAKLEVTNSTNGDEGIRLSDTRATPSANKRTVDIRYTGTNGRTASNTQLLYLTDNNASSTQPFMEVENASSSLFVIDSSGRVGIGAASPDSLLTLDASSNPAINIKTSTTKRASLIADTGSSQAVLGSFEGYPLVFSASTGGGTAEKARIDTSGRLLVGASTARANFLNGSVTGLSQVEGSGSGTSRGTFSVINNADTEHPATLLLGRSNANTVGSNTLSSDGDWCGRIGFMGNDGSEFVELASISGLVDGTPGANDMPGRLSFRVTADGASSPTEAMRIDSSGNVAIGNIAPAADLDVASSTGGVIRLTSTNTSAVANENIGKIEYFTKDADGAHVGAYVQAIQDPGDAFGRATALTFATNNTSAAITEALRIDRLGRLLVGTTSTLDATRGSINTFHSTSGGRLALGAGTVGAGSSLGEIFGFWNGNKVAGMIAVSGSDTTNRDDGELRFYTSASGPTLAQRMQIHTGGQVTIGSSDTSPWANTSGASTVFNATQVREGLFSASAQDGDVMAINRMGTDGQLVIWYAQGNGEGSVSVSGSTVSYNGGHLSRWSQLVGISQTNKADRPSILRGSVMSNLDELCSWKTVAFDVTVVDENGDETTVGKSIEYAGTADVGETVQYEYEGATYTATVGLEDNEQLNKMQVSSTEGDRNVAGVFQCWDDDDDTIVNDFYCAMTGDFVIRIAQGTTVARGDLLMSAGDGTAKPQDDDIVRSKTIAKVTSTTVSTTYADGSYCVPCVLMAC